MPVMVQIRNVPDDIHRKLRERALRAGMPLSEFLLREVAEIARRPSLDEVLDRIALRRAPDKAIDAAAAVRAERDGRR